MDSRPDLTRSAGTDLLDVRAMSTDRQTLDELRIDRAVEPRGGSRVGLILIACVLVILAAGAVWWFSRPKAAVVRTVVIQSTGVAGADRTLLNASGYVTARRQATVSSKVTGKVIEVLVEEGMKVEAGQVLARLDSSNVEKG